MEPHESHELIEQSEEAKHKSRNLTALFISVLAMVLAINNVGGGNSAKEATRHNIEASNFFAFYQAKSIKQHELVIAKDRLEIDLALNPKLTDSARVLLSQKSDEYAQRIERYENDEKSGEGKKQLLEKAKDHEFERDHALKQDPWFDYAEGILQIGIVLLSISILASIPALTIAGGLLGLIGTLCMLNGFFLFLS